jgi:hypothetical protein
MTDLPHAAGVAPAPASTSSGRAFSVPSWGRGLDDERVERDRLIGQARDTDAARQLQRCFPRWARAFEHLSRRALVRLAANEPVDVNDPDMWTTRDARTQAVLRRHGLTTFNAGGLSMAAVNTLLDGQAAADGEAGLDWSQLTIPANRLDEPLRRANARLPIDLSDPSVYAYVHDQRRALAGRLGLPAGQADDLSRWALSYPGEFDAHDLRYWRIGSTTWLALADEQLDSVERVQRPVGLFVAPAIRTEGWQLTPVLSLEAIRLLTALGGDVERDLCAATLPMDRVPALLERINVQRCTPDRRSASTPPANWRRSYRACCASTSARGCHATSGTGGAGSWSPGPATRATPVRSGSSCACEWSRSRPVTSPSGGLAQGA